MTVSSTWSYRNSDISTHAILIAYICSRPPCRNHSHAAPLLRKAKCAMCRAEDAEATCFPCRGHPRPNVYNSMIIVTKIRIQSRPITTRMEAALTNRLNTGELLFFLCTQRLVVGVVSGVGLRKLSNSGKCRDMYSEDIDVLLGCDSETCDGHVMAT